MQQSCVLHNLLNILLCNFRGVRQACLHKAEAAFDWRYLRLTLFRTLQTAIEFQHSSVLLAISSGLMMYSQCCGGICNHEQTNNISGNCVWWVVEILYLYTQRASGQLMTICIKVSCAFVSVRFHHAQSGEQERTDIYLHDGLCVFKWLSYRSFRSEGSDRHFGRLSNRKSVIECVKFLEVPTTQWWKWVTRCVLVQLEVLKQWLWTGFTLVLTQHQNCLWLWTITMNCIDLTICKMINMTYTTSIKKSWKYL